MTRGVKENQERLAARVRELVTVHQVGRAVSSVVDLDQVLRSVVGEALTVLNGKTAAIALTVDPAAGEGAVRPDGGAKRFAVRAVAGEPVGRRLAPMAEAVAALGWPRRTSAVEANPQLTGAAAASGLVGPMIAAPLSLKERVVGVILVGRLGEARFEEADLRLLVTFADQTATAIENARLYDEVRAFSENLELKVRERTAELEHANGEIEYALRELGAAQAPLIHSERMAALGKLVAGVAHEVNSPAAAMQGLVDALQDTVRRIGQCAHDLYASELPAKSVHRYFEFVDGSCPRWPTRRVDVAGLARRQRRLKAEFAGLPGGDVAAALVAEIGSSANVGGRAPLHRGRQEPGAARRLPARDRLPRALRGRFARRSARSGASSVRSRAIRSSIRRRSSASTCTKGIENTLVILHIS